MTASYAIHWNIYLRGARSHRLGDRLAARKLNAPGRLARSVLSLLRRGLRCGLARGLPQREEHGEPERDGRGQRVLFHRPSSGKQLLRTAVYS